MVRAILLESICMTSKSLLGFASAAARAAALPATPASAGVHVGIGINLTPPAERVEVVPARPHDGWVWIGGHWRRAGGQWVWVGGRWANPPRRGGLWVRGHYNRRGEWIEGHWK
jgi:hypothetical protein